VRLRVLSPISKELREDYTDKAVISIKSVSKAFATRPVLNSIDLDVAEGQSVCICGVNGAGKSTLLRIMAGLLQPDRGSVQLCASDVSTEPEKIKRQLGVISHKSMVYSELTCFENLSFFANLYGVKDTASRVNELLEEVGLISYRYDQAGILSRGLLQRLAIARALVHKPAVLLADEPFTGLDRESCEHLISALTAFADNSGTVVMTTHDVKTAVRCCGRMVVLDRSRLFFDAETGDIDVNDFVQDYLSYARANK
jgi:heme ABC exporter ATP-binding subunit CcmA